MLIIWTLQFPYMFFLGYVSIEDSQTSKKSVFEGRGVLRSQSMLLLTQINQVLIKTIWFHKICQEKYTNL